jgi:hypothetical protein
MGILLCEGIMPILLKQPLKARDAEKLIRSLTESGEVHFRNPHVAKRQTERKIENIDIINVLLRGRVREAEYENGE